MSRPRDPAVPPRAPDDGRKREARPRQRPLPRTPVALSVLNLQAMRKAELAWVRATVAELRDGTLPWPALSEFQEEASQD
jgi:hypothetical protein